MNFMLRDVPDELRRRLIRERLALLGIVPVCAAVVGWMVWRYHGFGWGLATAALGVGFGTYLVVYTTVLISRLDRR